MIFIKRDASLIPQKVIDVAQRAQNTLEQLPPEQRKDFIKRSPISGAGFQKYLAKCHMGNVGIQKPRMRERISM